MSSCAASCSICYRRASCAFATSDSSPIATAPHSCRCAFNCSAAQRSKLLSLHHRPLKTRTPSGTAQSAAEPCTSSSGSLLHNSCFAHRRNQTGTHMNSYQHPRHLTVPRHARGLLVLSAPPCSAGCLFSLRMTTHPDDLRLYLNPVRADLALHRNSLKPLYPISPIQST